jgi:hypothetical protein
MGLLEITLPMYDVPEIIEAKCDIGMVRSKASFADGQSTLV